MKDLPRVYVNKIEKEINNNKDFFYSRLQNRENNTKNILKEIDNIFHSKDFVYKCKVEITTNDDVLQTTIVGKTQDALLTMDGQQIKIIHIKDIKKSRLIYNNSSI